MTTLTIEIPDSEVREISSYIKKKGGKVVAKDSTEAIKKHQYESLKQGLTEAVFISRGDMEGTPLSELWDD